MRSLQWVLVLAIAVACVPAAVVLADRPAEKIVPEGTTVELILLRQKSVQRELKLSPDVSKRIMEFTDKQHDAFRNAIKSGKEGRKQKVRDMEKENRQFLKDTLAPEQRKRLDQITLQMTGLQQLSRPDVAKVLNLTEDQKQKFKALQKDTHKKLAQLLYDTSPEERKEQFAKMREDTRKKIRAQLTAAQKAKVKQLVGEPFHGDIVIEGSESAPAKK